MGSQKIKCNVCDCTHNNIDSSTCRLDEINICTCQINSTKDPLKDTACASYEYSEVIHQEKY